MEFHFERQISELKREPVISSVPLRQISVLDPLTSTADKSIKAEIQL